MGAPGAEDGCQRHLALADTCSERVPPHLAADDQMARLRSAALLEGTSGSATKTEFLDVALDASAQPWGTGRAGGLAEGQQLSFQGQLGGAPPLGLGMSAGFGPVVNRGRRRPTWPVAQHRGRGCAGRGCPAAGGPSTLLGAVIMVVGGVEIADQYSGESIEPRHDCFASTPPQEVAVRWGC